MRHSSAAGERNDDVVTETDQRGKRRDNTDENGKRLEKMSESVVQSETEESVNGKKDVERNLPFCLDGSFFFMAADLLEPRLLVTLAADASFTSFDALTSFSDMSHLLAEWLTCAAPAMVCRSPRGSTAPLLTL